MVGKPEHLDAHARRPGFRETLHYLDKAGMKWVLWFCGRPSQGVMDTKIGSWGDFQWRTDGVGGFDLATDRAFRNQIIRFLQLHPRSSFHTCNGGGRYAHTFEIQRYTDVNYFSDAGRGEQTNHASPISTHRISGSTSSPRTRKQGNSTPTAGGWFFPWRTTWYLHMTREDREQVRRIGEIYHFLLREGVAGRWSYVAHPVVQGNVEHAYFQRTSHDRTKACIIIKQRPAGRGNRFSSRVTAGPPIRRRLRFPSIDDDPNGRGPDGQRHSAPNAGAGELVYLGLPNRPGSGTDRTAPKPPGCVLSRRETNLGHTGVGLYWSPGTDDQAISFYEIRREGQLLGKAATGTYYFDRASGWDPQARYAVRTVDTDGNASDWLAAHRYEMSRWRRRRLAATFPRRGARVGLPRRPTTATVTPRCTGSHQPKTRQAIPEEPRIRSAAKKVIGKEQVAAPDWPRLAAGGFGGCLRRSWIAAQAGTVRVLGRAVKEYYRRNDGQSLRVRILKGDTQVWPEQGWTLVPVGDVTSKATTSR